MTVVTYLVINIIFSAIVCIVALVSYKKKKQLPLCDTCENLVIKNKNLCAGAFRYHCDKWRGFDVPPKWCKYYKRRKDVT